MRLSLCSIITIFVFRLLLLLFGFQDSKFLFDIEWSTFTSIGYRKQSHKFVRPRCFIFQWKPFRDLLLYRIINSIIIEYANQQFCPHTIANRFVKKIMMLKTFFRASIQAVKFNNFATQQKVALNMTDRSWMFVAKTNDYLWFLAPCWQTTFVLIS